MLKLIVYALYGFLIGFGLCWGIMHNDLSEGYRLGRIQGHKDVVR